MMNWVFIATTMAIFLWWLYADTIKHKVKLDCFRKNPLYFMLFIKITSKTYFVVIVFIDILVLLAVLLGIIQAITGY